MPSANTPAAQTEIEAVNSMLAAIGEDAVSTLEGTLPVEVTMAQSILYEVAREKLLKRWKFNTDFGYRLVPTATFTWTNADATTIDLSIFKPPANLLAFDVSAQAAQRDLQLVIRKSYQYVETMLAVPVLYDRANNRDGLDASKFTDLYIDPVWAIAFDDCPESFKAYLVTCAARLFVKRSLGSTELAQLTRDDELVAYRNLVEDQGEDDNYNIFDNYDVLGALGTRAMGPSGVFDQRSNVR